jgi:hypothetical protein
MNWTPMKRGKPRAMGPDTRYRKLQNIEVDLDREPPAGWEAEFQHPEGVSISLSQHPPQLRGRTIYLSAPDDEVEAYIRSLDQRIAAANSNYETRVLPKVEAAERQRQQAEEEAMQRKENVQDRLNKL